MRKNSTNKNNNSSSSIYDDLTDTYMYYTNEKDNILREAKEDLDAFCKKNPKNTCYCVTSSNGKKPSIFPLTQKCPFKNDEYIQKNRLIDKCKSNTVCNRRREDLKRKYTDMFTFNNNPMFERNQNNEISTVDTDEDSVYKDYESSYQKVRPLEFEDKGLQIRHDYIKYSDIMNEYIEKLEQAQTLLDSWNITNEKEKNKLVSLIKKLEKEKYHD